MNNLKNFHSFINEAKSRYPLDTKYERAEKQKQYFIKELIKRNIDKSEEELNKMDISELGRKLSSMKKNIKKIESYG